MSIAWIVSLREDVTVTTGDGPTVILESPSRRQVLQQCPSAFHPLIEKLQSPGIRYGELIDRARSTDVPNPAARLLHYLQLLARRGFVTLGANDGDRRLATFEPTSESFNWPQADVSDGQYLLSQYAYIHREQDRMLLESPLASGRFVIHDDRVATIASLLGRPRTMDDVVRQVPGLSRESAESLITLLHATKILTAVNSAAESAETGSAEMGSTATGSSAMDTWEFHDLLFHVRSRIGRHDAPLGATYRFYGRSDPPPTVKPVESEVAIELIAPDMQKIHDQDPSLCEAIEGRASIRQYGEQPIDLQQLGDFLYRTARVRAKYRGEVDTPHGPLEMEFVSRPYPSGGALYELEVYPLVQNCRGLDAGLYRYDPCEHQLLLVSPWTPELQRLVQGSAVSTGISPESVQVVLILSSRFPRIAWKYTSIAYALTLKHVGAVYQTMYLTATAMGLAPCAMGAGDSDLFAKAIGSGYYAETSVGEFLLGSRRTNRDGRGE